MELEILNLMTDRDIHDTYSAFLDYKLLSAEAKEVLLGFAEYYKVYPTANKIDLLAFEQWWLTGKSIKFQTTYKVILSSISATTITATAEVLLKNYIEQSLAEDLNIITKSILDKDGLYSMKDVSSSIKWCDTSIDKLSNSHHQETTLDEALSIVLASGYNLGITILKRGIGLIKAGDTLLIGGRSDSGKTTFLATITGYLIPQVPANRPIVVLCNEESASKIGLRYFQSVMGKSIDTIAANKAKYEPKYKIFQDKVKIISIHGYTTVEIEALLTKLKPSVLIIDQLHNVELDNKTNRRLGTETARLGELFKWFRTVAATYCIPAITVHQLDGTAEGEDYIGMNKFENAKTAIQQHMDTIITIGRKYGSGEDKKRYIHIPKNKSTGGGEFDEAYRNLMMEVIYDPIKGRFL